MDAPSRSGEDAAEVQQTESQAAGKATDAQQTVSQAVGITDNNHHHGAHKRYLPSNSKGNTDNDSSSARRRRDVANRTPTPNGNAHASPGTSLGTSSVTEASTINHPFGKPKYFKSRYIADKSKIEKPWLDGPRPPREKWQNIIPMIGFYLGLALAAFLIWSGHHSVTRNLYCPVMREDFTLGRLDETKWSAEIEVGGFGLGQFDQTTNDPENIYVGGDGTLYLRPTLQDASLIEHNHVIDLRGNGCTGRHWTDCVAVTNTTNGTIVNPVKSARINTRLGANIRYGRVEVTAKLPAGDWLWPSIFMMPTNNTYGEWPQSGQIDIIQSRGNNYTYADGGNNKVASRLHFGPNAERDASWRTHVQMMAMRTTFSDRFYKFGVEWTEKYIFTYVDTQLQQVLYTHFKKPFWEIGEFPKADNNGTHFTNPWSDGTAATPFDQDFYLVIKVGVGATNGWFPDNVAGKPWVDREGNPELEFWNARDQWHPTWDKQGWMEVKNVVISQLANYKGCMPEDAKKFVGA